MNFLNCPIHYPLKEYGVRGQALIEYLIILGLLSFVGARSVQTIGTMMAKSMGNLASVMSIHLSVGVCGKNGQENCFYTRYKNGIEN